MYPYSLTNAMAGFHLHGDPYFPKTVVGLKRIPEEDPEEIMGVEDEEDSEGMDSDPEAYNPPQADQYLAIRQNFRGPIPRWVVDLRN